MTNCLIVSARCIARLYQKFQEAKDLVALGAIEIIEDSFSLEKELHHLIAFSEKAQEKGQIAREYVKSKTGASQHILSHLEQNKLL